MTLDPVNTGANDRARDTESRAHALDSDAAAPSRELPAPGPELFERAREAVSAIRGRGRLDNGQAGPGNTLNLRHGLHSAQLTDQPAIAAWHQEETEAIESDLGGEAELSVLQRASVREVARLEVIAAALGNELLEHGVLTGKGQCRSATNTYLQVLDRFVRLAGTLGLARRQRRIPSAHELLTQPQSGEE